LPRQNLFGKEIFAVYLPEDRVDDLSADDYLESNNWPLLGSECKLECVGQEGAARQSLLTLGKWQRAGENEARKFFTLKSRRDSSGFGGSGEESICLKTEGNRGGAEDDQCFTKNVVSKGELLGLVRVTFEMLQHKSGELLQRQGRKSNPFPPHPKNWTAHFACPDVDSLTEFETGL
jgi:hypothetical protein